MTRVQAATLITAVATACVPAFAQVNLAATIRDFNNSDSSFNNSRQNNGGCPGTGYVQDTLGPDRKPLPTQRIDAGCNPGDSLRMANDWFTTDTTYTNSAATCIDIPMDVDSTGLYTYNDTSFFPIDTFNTLPNGKSNPFNVKYRAHDGKQHNFSFCMEMHGTFDYKAGQVFNFAGDDDVWFFINNHLEVDLGGTHATENGSVDLDTLGLAVGKTYPWDFFFCERHTTGSDILISTTMNLRTTSNFAVEDSVLGAAHHLYSLWVTQSNSSSCVATSSRTTGVGQFTLTGTGLAGTDTLGVGTSYGGITVGAKFGSVALDSSAITGLAPGSYVLHIYQQGSATSFKEITFTVPARTRTLVFTDSTGATKDLAALVSDVYQPVAVYLEAFADGVFCSACRDSVALTVGDAHLRLSATPSGSALSSVRLAGGKAKIWVVSYRPVDSSRITARSDSAALPAVRFPVSFLAPRLVFVDSTGALSETPPLNIPVGGKATIHVELLTSTGVCTACSDSVTLSSSSDRILFLDASGNPISAVLPHDGTASFQIYGWAPVQDASISAADDSMSAKATWRPVSVTLAAASGVLTDSDADGQADLVRLALPADASVFSFAVVRWPAADGTLDTRRIKLPASGTDLSISLPPFAFGSTSCPSAGCADLGKLALAHGTDTVLVSFPVLDGVVPIPTRAQYDYSPTGSVPDTLVVHFSEPVRASGLATAPWVSTGRPSADSLGKAVVALAMAQLSSDGLVARFLVDSTTGIQVGDSLRVSAAPTGALSDTSGNSPGRLAWWTPIVWTRPPLVISVDVPHAVVSLGAVAAPADEQPVTVLVHPDMADPSQWEALEGATPTGLDDRFAGVVVHLNRIPDNLGMYVYDRLGVSVLRQDLSNLAAMAASGLLKRDTRGNYELWLAWDGKDGRGREAASGIYTLRVFGWIREDGDLYLLNQLKTNGLHRTAK